jgi:hypothetical protein
MKVLVLRDCPDITDDGVRAVMDGCLSLNELAVSSNVTLSMRLELAILSKYAKYHKPRGGY